MCVYIIRSYTSTTEEPKFNPQTTIPVTQTPIEHDQKPFETPPRRILTPPTNLTPNLPDPSEKSDEYNNHIQLPRRSARIEAQNKNSLSERVLEIAGQQLRKTNTKTPKQQVRKPTTSNLRDLLNKRRQDKQMGTPHNQSTITPERTNENNINEIYQIMDSNIKITKDDLFRTPSSMGHCVSSHFFMGAEIAEQFDHFYPRIKQEAWTTLAPWSVFANNDPYSRRWIYSLVTKLKHCHKAFYNPLKESPILTREHAEKRGVRNIRLPEVGCGIDKLQWRSVKRILADVFDQTTVSVTVCINPPQRRELLGSNT